MEHTDDINLVELWLRRDSTRWVAGAFAGILAGAMAMVVAMIFSKAAGYEIWFPLKLMAAIPMGASATEVGTNMAAIITGLIVYGVLCVFLAMVYAHFTVTNLLSALLGMGLVWGIFSWIFIWNLFLPSFRVIFAAKLPSGPAFLICIVFGLALTSVAFFDRVLRGR